MPTPHQSYRIATINRGAVDPAARTADLSFSSEAPVARWMGDEYLLHGRDNADLTRLTTVGAVLYGHHAGDMNNIIGRVVSAKIDTTRRRGVATIVFDDDDGGEKALKKVQTGSLRGVSVGYTIREAVRVEEGEKWQDPESGKIFPGPALVATRWEVYEISLTPVPADPSVGVGRDLTRDLTGIKFLSEEETLKMTRKLIPIDRLNEIFDRAKRVSPECLARVVDLAEAGAAEGELLTEILDAMGITAGAGARQNERRLPYRSFSEIPNDVLAFALKYPNSAPMSPATKSGRQPAAPPARRATLQKLSEISDKAFAEAFKNPFYLY